MNSQQKLGQSFFSNHESLVYIRKMFSSTGADIHGQLSASFASSDLSVNIRTKSVTKIRLLSLKQSDLGLHCLSLRLQNTKADDFYFICFVPLRPKSTAMVMAGRPVHLTTLFPGQA